MESPDLWCWFYAIFLSIKLGYIREKSNEKTTYIVIFKLNIIKFIYNIVKNTSFSDLYNACMQSINFCPNGAQKSISPVLNLWTS